MAMIWLLLLVSLAQNPTVRTLDRGDQSRIDEPRQVVARTADEWRTLWRQHAEDRPAPAVDLAREMVVGVFLGTRPTAGYGVEVVGVEVRDGAVVVRYRESRPAPGSLTAQVLTAPFHVVALPQRPGEIRFERIDP
jgi:hypothetical protein